jgi:flagellar biosynthesis anti-sigma factor FlgM
VRIDLNQPPQTLVESGRSTSNVPANTQGSASASVVGSSGLGEDQAQLSGLHAQVQALAAQAAQLPDVRQEKVSALRQVVIGGSYKPSANQVAQAIFDQMVVAPAA